MGWRRHALEGASEAAIEEAAGALGWRLSNIASGPRRLVYGGDDWQACFTVGSHVDLSGHDVDALARALGEHLTLRPIEASPPPPPGAPARPRLADTVEARLIVEGGEVRARLHDLRSDAVIVVDATAWDALRAADGTRDADALRLAAGRPVDLRAAGEAGMLADGLAPAPPEPPVPSSARRERPVEALPGYRLRCDGSGGCCRAYGSVPFDPEEAARARATGLAPIDPDRLFSPYRGARWATRAVAWVDEACAFLGPDDACRLHAAHGPGAKPFACRLFPATAIDDGAAVRVSAAPECACVFESDGADRGAPLVDPGPLDPRVPVRALPDPVPLDASRVASREAYRAWSDRLLRRVEAERGDLAAFALGLAAAVRAGGLEAGVDVEPRRAPIASGSELEARARHPAHTRQAREVAGWALESLAALDGWPEPRQREAERFYLRALTFGHRLAVEGRPLVQGLRERAARLICARAMHAVDAPSPRLARHPLAALEAALRHLGARLCPADSPYSG